MLTYVQFVQVVAHFVRGGVVVPKEDLDDLFEIFVIHSIEHRHIVAMGLGDVVNEGDPGGSIHDRSACTLDRSGELGTASGEEGEIFLIHSSTH